MGWLNAGEMSNSSKHPMAVLASVQIGAMKGNESKACLDPS